VYPFSLDTPLWFDCGLDYFGFIGFVLKVIGSVGILAKGPGCALGPNGLDQKSKFTSGTVTSAFSKTGYWAMRVN
jgi:hypothetical protein